MSLTDTHQSLEELHRFYSPALRNDPEADKMLMKQLTLENANETCREALRSFYKGLNIQRMVRLCKIICTSHCQG